MLRWLDNKIKIRDDGAVEVKKVIKQVQFEVVNSDVDYCRSVFFANINSIVTVFGRDSCYLSPEQCLQCRFGRKKYSSRALIGDSKFSVNQISFPSRFPIGESKIEDVVCQC